MALLRRRAFGHGIRSDDVFIVAYPRSGSTWLACMLCPFAGGRFDEPPFSDLGAFVPDVNVEYFEGRGTLRRYRGLSRPRLMRVHALHDAAFPRVVYVLRDPRDVLVSNFHWQLLHGADFDTLHDYVHAWESHFPSEWGEHVRSWSVRDDGTMLVVRYEEMMTDPAATLSKVLEFAAISHEPAAVTRAVDGARFERLQAIEQRVRALSGSPTANGERMIRRGEAGGWRDEMDADLVRDVEQRYGSVMDRVGYDRAAT